MSIPQNLTFAERESNLLIKFNIRGEVINLTQHVEEWNGLHDGSLLSTLFRIEDNIPEKVEQALTDHVRNVHHEPRRGGREMVQKRVHRLAWSAGNPELAKLFGSVPESVSSESEG